MQPATGWQDSQRFSKIMAVFLRGNDQLRKPAEMSGDITEGKVCRILRNRWRHVSGIPSCVLMSLRVQSAMVESLFSLKRRLEKMREKSCLVWQECISVGLVKWN